MKNSSDFKQFAEEDIRPTKFDEEHQKILLEDINMLLSRQNEFVECACPACNMDDSEFQFSKREFSYVQCKNCQTMYISPRPSKDVLRWFYRNSKNYEFWDNVVFPATEESRHKNIILPRVNKTIEICKKYNTNTDSLLEIGAGFGTYCAEIQSRNIFRRVVAVEPTPNLASTCRKRNIETIELPIEEIEISSDSMFDVIVNFEVIEHIFSPREFLSHVHRMLNQDGLLILSCPNGKGFDVNTLKVKSDTVDHEHLNYFNPYSIGILLRSCGFRPLEVFTPGRLDTELVRKKIVSGEFNLENDESFLRHVLVDEWDKLGALFQQFLVKNSLSSSMWAIAQKRPS